MARFRARAPSAGTVDVKRLIYVFKIIFIGLTRQELILHKNVE